jgi:hypothetical protein
MGAAEGLRWAILLSSSVGLVAVVLFLMGRRTIREEIKAYST